MGHAGIVTYVESGAGHEARQVVKVGDADGVWERRVVFTRAPSRGEGQTPGDGSEFFERPVLARTPGKGVNHGIAFARGID